MLVSRREQRARRPGAWLGWVVVLGAFIAIVALTLVPGRGPQPATRAFLLGPPGATDIIYNVVLFVPLGVGLRLAGWKASRVALAAAAFSGAIEFYQWLWIPSRFSSLADIIANTAGAVTGALLVVAFPWWIQPTRRVARMSALVFAAAWVLVTVGASLLLRLQIPPTPTWWGQWAHTFATTVPLPGRILTVEANGLPIPDDTLSSTRALQQSARRDGITLKVTATGMTSVAGRAQVAAIADGRGNLVIAIEQERCLFRLVDQRRGEAIGLRMLALNLPGECAPPDDTVAIVARSTNELMAISVRTAAGLTADSLRVTPATAWRLVAPSPRRVAHPVLLGVAWIALFLVPLAWFTRLAASRPTPLLLACLWLFGSATMIAAAWPAQLAFPTPLELAAIAGTAAVGWLAAVQAARSGSDRLPDGAP